MKPKEVVIQLLNVYKWTGYRLQYMSIPFYRIVNRCRAGERTFNGLLNEIYVRVLSTVWDIET